MNYVYYDIESDSMPPEFALSPAIEQLLAFKVKSQHYGKENDVIERCNRLSRESTFEKLDRTSHLDIFSKPPEAVAKETPTHIPTITPISSSDNNNTMRKSLTEEEVEEMAYVSPPELVKKSSYNVVEDFSIRQGKLDRMVADTGQSVDVCHFYLEMVDWDYDSALQMFGSLSSS